MLLRKGMNNPDVLNVELVLQGLGFEGFEADGIFDEKTENVIKYIQKTNNLDIDGKVGPATFDVLDRLYEPFIANFAPELTPAIETPRSSGFARGLEELEHVHPLLATKVLLVIQMAAAEGYDLTTVQGLRTFAEQDKLFTQRPRVTKARGGQSYHNYGVAVDLAFIVDGKISWQDSLYRNIGRWASRAGLEWGGHWHFVDYPHIQLNNLQATGNLMVTYKMAGGGDRGIQAVWNKFVH